MAKIGELVAEIKLNTEDAIKNAGNFKKVLKESKDSLKDLDEIQRKTTKTSENYDAQMGIVNTTLTRLQKEYEAVGKGLAEYEANAKKANVEAGKSEELSKAQTRELQQLSNQYMDLSKGIQNMQVRYVSLERAKEELINTTELQAQKERDLELQREVDAKKQEERIKRESKLRDEQVELDRQREARQTEQYTREIQDRRLEARETQVEFVSNVGQGMSNVSDSVTSGVKRVFEEYMAYEQVEAGILRLSKGNEQQNTVLTESIQTLMSTNHEDNSVIADAIESVITSVSPDKYGDVLQGAVQNVLDLSLATGLSSEESASAILAVVRATGSSIEQAPNLFSGFNAIENVKEGVDTAHAVGTATTAAVPLINAGFSWDEITAWTTMNSIQSQKGSGSDATSLIALADTISKYNDKTEIGTSFLRRMGMSLESFLAIGENAIMADENVKEYLKANNLSASDVVKSLDDMQLNVDLQNALGLSSPEEVDNWMQSNGMLQGLVELSKYFNTLVTSDKSYAAVVADRSYLSGNTNANIAMQNLSTFDDSADFIQLSKDGNAQGTSLKDEADVMRETSMNQIKEFYKRLQFDLIEIGGELAPVLMDMLPGLEGLKDSIIGMVKAIASLPPGVLQALVIGNLGMKVGGMALSGVGTLFNMTNQWKQFQVANKVLSSTKGAIPAINAMNAGGTVLGGVDDLNDAIKGLSNVSKEASTGIGGMGSKIVGTLGVGGTVVLALAATAAVAAGFLALEHQANEANKRAKGWQREGSDGISQEVRDSVYEVTEPSRAVNYKINNALNGGDIEIGDIDVTSFNETANAMVSKISESVQNKITALGDLEELGINVEAERMDLTSIQSQAEEVQGKITGILNEIVESDGQHSEEQLKALKGYQDELDRIYAAAFSDTATQQLTIREELERSRLGENLAYGDKVERISGINASIEEEEFNYQRNLSTINNRKTALENSFNAGEIGQEEYNKELKTYDEALEKLYEQRKNMMGSLLAEAQYLFESMSVFEKGKFVFDDTKKELLKNSQIVVAAGSVVQGRDEDGNVISGAETQRSDIYGAAQHAKVLFTDGMSEEQLALVERYNNVLKEITQNDELLTSMDANIFDFGVALQYMGDEGITALFNLKEQLGEALPPTFLENAKEQASQYLSTLSEAELATEQGLQLQVYSNTSETVDDFISLHNLWTNTDFLELWLNTDFKDEESRAKLADLTTELTGLSNRDFEIWVTDNLGGVETKAKSLIERLKEIPRKIGVAVGNFFGNNAYAEGTNYHNGGPAWLGDGFEPELVREPNGKTWITPDQPFLYNLPRGSVVIPQHDWASKHLPKFGFPRYKDGVGYTLAGETSESTSYNVTVNAYTSDVNIPLIKSEITKSLREIELNNRRIKSSGGES